ncbi:DUF4249 domain-containing protein [uncultured Parabacteroides sp.]|uniref:DUF4249 domain-containing protein n=1 Tax=uncultured Parabacteroides sp. TaxID=512312 RepID=UPI00261FDF29|nr:DUF4249 domain-containing protein [uncultured Parabacteroides sp.]
MKQIKNILINLICMVCLSCLMSCVKEIDLESLRPDPTLVVNCVAITGEPLTVSVSRTWFFTDDHPNVTLDKAEVKLFVNGIFRERMSFQEGDEVFNTRGYFKSDFIPVEGDRIRVEASYPEYGVANAETVVPEPVQVLKAGVTYVTAAGSTGSHLNAIYQVTFKDNPSEENYYLLRMEEGVPIFDGIAKEYTGEYKWYPVTPNYATEPVFGQSLTALDQIFGNNWMFGDGGKVFSDELINGQEYTLHLTDEYYYEFQYGAYPIKIVPDSMWIDDFSEEDLLPIPSMHLRVHLHAISAEYYRYLKVLQDKDTGSISNLLIDGGLAEPIRVFSNIDGGIGILGSCNVGVFETEIESSSHSDLKTARFEDGID